MQKRFIFSYLCILVTLLVFLSLSHPTTEKMRGNFVSFLAPLWEKIALLKTSSRHSEKYPHESGMPLSPQEEIQRLLLENQLLSNELLYTSKLLEDKQAFDHHVKDLVALSDQDLPFLQTNYHIYLQRLKKSIAFKIHALPARVIFRSLGTWNNSLWINVGEANNQFYSNKIIAKNSPVILGQSVIGVIDYVGTYQSRVCLITDPRLTPSVRAVRGGEQDIVMAEHIHSLLSTLHTKNTLMIAENDRQTLIHLLNQTMSTLQPAKKSWYLAKGELQGSIRSSGRVQSQILKGSGFNYDFSDEEGGARDLRTGQLSTHSQDPPVPLLKPQDILVTTGLDGVFPPNLHVATIVKIDLLKEGDYFYDVEAKPAAGNLNELSFVLVIPPMNLGFIDNKD